MPMPQINFNPFPCLNTASLQLRKLNVLDQEDLLVLQNNSEVRRYINRDLHRSVLDTRAFIQNILDKLNNNELVYWAICFQEQQQLIGTICLWNIDVEYKQCDLGYELLPLHQGKGIMSNALQLVLEYAFEELVFDRVRAYTHSQNQKSRRLLEKNDFKVLRVENNEAVYLCYNANKSTN